MRYALKISLGLVLVAGGSFGLLTTARSLHAPTQDHSAIPHPVDRGVASGERHRRRPAEMPQMREHCGLVMGQCGAMHEHMQHMMAG